MDISQIAHKRLCDCEILGGFQVPFRVLVRLILGQKKSDYISKLVSHIMFTSLLTNTHPITSVVSSDFVQGANSGWPKQGTHMGQVPKKQKFIFVDLCISKPLTTNWRDSIILALNIIWICVALGSFTHTSQTALPQAFSHSLSWWLGCGSMKPFSEGEAASLGYRIHIWYLHIYVPTLYHKNHPNILR